MRHHAGMYLRARWAKALLILVALIMVFAILLLSSSRGRSAFRIAPGFVRYGPDPRVYYEAGCEEVAARFAEALPEAVARVEGRLSLPFKSEFRVYVFGSHESFAHHFGQPATTPVRGHTLLKDIWVSPKAFAFRGEDTTVETLAHELAHLHFGQHLGWFGRTRLMPTWFNEGLADWVSGTGYDTMSEDDALVELRKGNYFAPDASGGLPLPKRAEDYGMTWPPFHAQSRMFVEYLHSGREASFTAFVAAVLGGSRFDVAFSEHFGQTLEEEWRDFLERSQGTRT